MRYTTRLSDPLLYAALIIEAADDSEDLGGDGEELGTTTYDDEVFIRFENNAGDGREIVLDSDDGEISGDDSDEITVSNEDNGDPTVNDPNFEFTLSNDGKSVEIKVAEDGTSKEELNDLTLELNNVDIGGTTVTLTRDFEINVTDPAGQS